MSEQGREKWSFDDDHIGWTKNNNRSLSTRKISRPGALSLRNWYGHASAVCQLLNERHAVAPLAGAAGEKNKKLADDLERDPAGISILDMDSVRQIIAALRTPAPSPQASAAGEIESLRCEISAVSITSKYDGSNGKNERPVTAVFSDILYVIDTRLAALRTPAPSPAVGGEEKCVLWCAHVRGPDDVHAADSYEDAVKISDEINRLSDKAKEMDILLVAMPAIWPWSKEAHAVDLAIRKESTHDH